MRFSSCFVAVLGAGLLLTSCVGSGMSTGGTYRATIGTSTRPNVRRTVPNILTSQYGYRFDRTIDRSGYMRYLTDWQQHILMEAEKSQGYQSSRTRIEVIARPRDRAAGTYTVTFKVEYRVRRPPSGEWVAVEIPPERQEYIDSIYQDLSDDLASGVIGP